MTRRIALAILISGWAVVLLALVVVYFTTRQGLVAELDQSIVLRASNLPHLAGVPEQGTAALPAGDRYVVRNEVGQVITRLEAQPSAQGAPVVKERKFISLGDGTRVRSLTLNFAARSADGQLNREVTIVYSAPADALDGMLQKMAIILVVVALGGGLVIGGVALVVSKMALRELRQTAEVIGTIDESKLDRRVDIGSLPEELGPMALRLNEMLARLEREFGQRKRFLADTAHELRTPVAAILTRLEVTLRRPREAGALTDALRIALSDVRLLRRLVDALLEQVRNDRTLAGKEPMCVDVSALLEQCAALADSLACAKEVTIERKFASGLLGEFQLVGLQSIITNLLANAVQYSPVGSSIELSASAVGNQLQLSVRDCGPGIDQDVLPHIFEPFYRGDSAHNGNEGHLGLGLFLVQSHAKAMGGRCEVDTAVGMGCVFRVWLPLSPADSAGNLRQRVLDRSNEFKVTEHGEVAMES